MTISVVTISAGKCGSGIEEKHRTASDIEWKPCGDPARAQPKVIDLDEGSLRSPNLPEGPNSGSKFVVVRRQEHRSVAVLDARLETGCPHLLYRKRSASRASSVNRSHNCVSSELSAPSATAVATSSAAHRDLEHPIHEFDRFDCGQDDGVSRDRRALDGIALLVRTLSTRLAAVPASTTDTGHRDLSTTPHTRVSRTRRLR